MQAIERAVDALAQRQLPHGEFPTSWSYTRDMADPQPVSSPFITGLILDLLGPVGGITGIEAIRDRGLDYLAGLRPKSGRFRFFSQGIDPDLDDICLLNLVLQESRPDAYDYGAVARAAAATQTSDGWFPTWLRSHRGEPNDRDACVNVNVLRFLVRNGIEVGMWWLEPEMRRWKAASETLYYVQPYALLHFACQLPRPWRDRLLSMGGIGAATVENNTHQDVLDAALRLTAAVSLKADRRLIRSLARVLLEAQEETWAWLARGAFQAFNYWGSESLTTAACMRALWDSRQSLG